MKNVNYIAAILCLFLSIILWFLVKLSSNTFNNITFTVNYKNLPKNKASKIKLPKFIIAEVKSTGWNYLFYQQQDKKNESIDINYDLITNAKQNYTRFETNKLIEILQRKIKGDLKIINVTPNEIYLSFVDLKTKKLPVVFNKKLSFLKNYEPISSFSFSPDSIVVTGPIGIINTLKSWQTDSLIIENLDKSLTGKIELNKFKEGDFTFSDTLINYNLTVDRFTEKNLTVKIKTINNFTDKDILLLPKNANLKFKVPLKNYDLVKEDNFEIVADFKEDAKNGLVKLTLTKKPKGIKKIIMYPKSVDYIRY